MNNDTSLEQTPSQPSPVLDKLRSLIRDKTRFEPEDVEKISEEAKSQPYGLSVKYRLAPKVTVVGITGHYSTQVPSHISSDAPEEQAKAERIDRLKLAGQGLEESVKASGIKYKAIESGVLLKHDTEYWHLSTCGGCRGRGRVDCFTCGSRGKVKCPTCHGALKINCTNYCIGGKVNCSYCHGVGTVTKTEYVTKSVSVWNQATGMYETHYQSVPVTGSVPCTHYGCLYGKVTCNVCNGLGQINCNTCGLTGEVTCSACSGLGDLQCSPCIGSGKTGTAAWVDVEVEPEYSIELPENAFDEAKSVVGVQGPENLPQHSSEFSFLDVSSIDGNGIITAKYAGEFALVWLKAKCGDNPYNIVAYGNDHQWLTLDKIVEHLLEKDLSTLRNALLSCVDQGIFATEVQPLLAAVKNVIASEVNADVLDAEDDQAVDSPVEVMVSPELAKEIKTNILGSLRQIYLRLAKKFWWKSLLATVIVFFLSRGFLGSFWAILLGLGAAYAGLKVFQRSVAKLLSREMHLDSHGTWLAQTAEKSSRNAAAKWIILAPSIMATLLLWHYLPVDEGHWLDKFKQTSSQQQESSGNQAQQPQDGTQKLSQQEDKPLNYIKGKVERDISILPSIEGMTTKQVFDRSRKLYREGKYVEAFRTVGQLQEKGNQEAAYMMAHEALISEHYADARNYYAELIQKRNKKHFVEAGFAIMCMGKNAWGAEAESDPHYWDSFEKATKNFDPSSVGLGYLKGKC